MWKGSYGCYSYTIIPKLLDISIVWDKQDSKTGYSVSIGRRKLKNLYGDIIQAKQAGIKFAKMIQKELELSIIEMEKELQ